MSNCRQLSCPAPQSVSAGSMPRMETLFKEKCQTLQMSNKIGDKIDDRFDVIKVPRSTTINNLIKFMYINLNLTSGMYVSIVNADKTAHFLLNFTLNKIRLAQIMNNRVYFVRNTCYFDVQ